MENQEEQQSASKQPVEGEFLSGKEMLELERERIKSADKRTDIARRAIEANEAADKRMFDFHMSRLDKETEFQSEQIKVAKRLIYGGSAFLAAIIVLLLCMSFFGTESQAETASILLEKSITALGGIAVYMLGKGALSKLTKPPSE